MSGVRSKRGPALACDAPVIPASLTRAGITAATLRFMAERVEVCVARGFTGDAIELAGAVEKLTAELCAELRRQAVAPVATFGGHVATSRHSH